MRFWRPGQATCPDMMSRSRPLSFYRTLGRLCRRSAVWRPGAGMLSQRRDAVSGPPTMWPWPQRSRAWTSPREARNSA